MVGKGCYWLTRTSIPLTSALLRDIGVRNGGERLILGGTELGEKHSWVDIVSHNLTLFLINNKLL